MQKRYAVLAFTLAVAAAGAQAQQRLPTLDQDMAGPRSQVLVLGSVHLSGLPESFKPDSLKPVLDKLAAFKPDIITVETLPGEQCDLAARHPQIYLPEEIGPYCVDTAPAKAATGLDVPAATAQAHKALKEWPAQPSAAQRRHLAALFLAAGERPSALVQWLQLDAAERKSGDGLDDVLVAQLKKLTNSKNESLLIGSHLAARLGLQRIYNTDDHTGDNLQPDDVKAYGAAIEKAWEGAAAATKEFREEEDKYIKDGDMLALYRVVNSPARLRKFIEVDFGAALRDPSLQRYGRQYVASWEARNLRMVASIRVAFRERPGARVLAIVGSSHKPWFDGLLGQMQGVEIVDAEKALK